PPPCPTLLPYTTLFRSRPFGPDRDLAGRPFAGVVTERADPTLEVRARAAKRQIGRTGDVDQHRLVGIDALERALQVAQHRQDVGARAENRAGGDRPGARQMVIDLAAHQGDLAADQLGERALAAARFVGQHAERRLEAVGEIADVGARALDQGLVVVEEGVQLPGQRLDLGREVALEARAGAGANRAQRPADPPQRLEAEAHLDQHRADHADEQYGERDGQEAVEALPIGLDLAPVAGDRV